MKMRETYADLHTRLRPYQMEAFDGVLAKLRAHRSTLLVMATGTGKTRVYSSVAMLGAMHGRRVLVLAHRSELLAQGRADMMAAGVPRVALEQGPSKARTGDDIVVASVATLKGKRLAAWPRDWFDLIIIDEAHRAPAKGYQNVIEHFSGAKVLGVTATPWRLDGKGLGEVFESVAFEYPIERGIREGHLVTIQSHRVVVEGLRLDGVAKQRGDLDAATLSKLLTDESHLHGVVAPLLELADQRPTVVFAVDVAHGKALVSVLERNRPGCAALVTGDSSPEVRATVYERHRLGEVQFLVNCQVLTEGWDAPYVSCVAVARPTMSWSLYAQMIGRGTRLHPGKRDLLVLDFTGQAGKHALVGPEDVLAGRVLDEATRAAVRLMAEQHPELAALDLLDMATAWLAEQEEKKRQQAAITAVADFYTQQIDPFLGKVQRDADGVSAHYYQLKALADLGFKPPESLSAGDAAQLLLELQDRDARGLATYKQVRWFAQRGMIPSEARAMSKAEASERFSTMRRTGRWKVTKRR